MLPLSDHFYVEGDVEAFEAVSPQPKGHLLGPEGSGQVLGARAPAATFAKRGVFDAMSMMQQLGAIPGPG